MRSPSTALCPGDNSDQLGTVKELSPLFYMSLSIGIAGLPNVGKSTLFKALTKNPVDCSNYPFCTIEPNVGIVEVQDERVDKLAETTGASRKIYSAVKFVDIAGLVEGAHQGEGLGNQFLAHVREADALLYVLRVFKNEKVVNPQNEINAIKEKEVLDAEMALKDLSTLEKRLNDVEREARQGIKEAQKEMAALTKARALLQENRLLFEQNIPEEEGKALKNLHLLTLKPRLYLLNGSENEAPNELKEVFQKNRWPFVIIDVLTEEQAIDFIPEERREYGLTEKSALDILITRSYGLLNLITFFTLANENEVRAWPLLKGSKASKAGGVVHSDFEEKFIKAEVINWQTLVEEGGLNKAREKGLIRTEGKDYTVKDGDVITIKIAG